MDKPIINPSTLSEEQRKAISKNLAELPKVSYEEVQQRLKDAFAPPHPSATISGWVARDQSNSFSKRGPLHVFHHKPSRDYFDDNDVICGFWDEDISPSLPLAENLFPSLTWQDEPIEVEITIKPKKQ